MKIKGVIPVKRKDGTWDLVEYEKEKEYPESAIRHCDLCTACGFTAYPECTETCNGGRLKIASV